MWLGHSIEHLVCIGGELEHPNALSSPARKIEHCGVLCYGDEVYIGNSFVPVRGWNRDQWMWARSEAHWSRFVPRTRTNGSRRTGTKAHEAPADHLGSQTRTNAPIGPGSYKNRD